MELLSVDTCRSWGPKKSEMNQCIGAIQPRSTLETFDSDNKLHEPSITRIRLLSKFLVKLPYICCLEGYWSRASLFLGSLLVASNALIT